MLIRNLTADHVYLACGRTDMRKSIDGLAALVLSKFQLDPHQPALFLFCGRRKDRIKGLLWDETGFLLLYKRLENGQYQWPDNGRTRRKICWKFPSSSYAGLPKAYLFHSPRLYKKSLQNTAFKFKLCITSANLWIAKPASVLTSRAFCGIME